MGTSRFWPLVEKELKTTLLSRRFPVILAVSTLLILLSVLLGVRQYNEAVLRVEAGHRILAQEIDAAEHWYSFSNTVQRVPDPMLILVAGVDYDVGRKAGLSVVSDPALDYSVYSGDPLFALFRFFDFSFVVQVVLSLMAILFTYDVISGEREEGTLKMMMANPVARPIVVLAKFTGSGIGLLVPIVLAMLLSVLVVMLLGIDLSTDDWLRLTTLMLVAVVYVKVFVSAGILVSSLTRKPSTSFLVVLSIWAVMVLVVPRLATVVAGQIVDTMTVAELEGKRSRFAREKFRELGEAQVARWKERQAEMEGMSAEERRQYWERNQTRFAEEDTEDRQNTFSEIDAYSARLREQRRNETETMESLALNMARVTPAAAFQLAAMRLAGTGLETKQSYMVRLRDYQKAYSSFLNEKMGSGMVVLGDPPKPTLAELPQFDPPKLTFRAALAPALIDIGLLVLYVLLAFAGSYVAFLRYDVR